MEHAHFRFEWSRDTVSGSIVASNLVCLRVLRETSAFLGFELLHAVVVVSDIQDALPTGGRGEEAGVIRKPPSTSASILDHTLQFLPTAACAMCCRLFECFAGGYPHTQVCLRSGLDN